MTEEMPSDHERARAAGDAEGREPQRAPGYDRKTAVLRMLKMARAVGMEPRPDLEQLEVWERWRRLKELHERRAGD